MFKKLLLVFVCLCVITAAAQTPSKTNKYTVSGVIMSGSTRAPLDYATVTLFDSLKPINATYSDVAGAFKLPVPAGSYTLKISQMGCADFEKRLTISRNLVLDTIFLDEGVEAKAVVVRGQLITTDMDKTVYNTSADPETPALTALEMMRKVPMLTVDGDDNLRLNGQTNFKILINGKESTLMSSNYKDVLKSMPAGSIKNIEVITNPPAKYDAEGIGGIINIVTDRKAPEGFNGSLTAGVKRFGSWNANGYIAATLGKFSASANYFINEGFDKDMTQMQERENYTSENARFMALYANGQGRGLNQGFNVEASYQIDTTNLLTLNASGFFGNGEITGLKQSQYFNTQRQQTAAFDNYTTFSGGYSSLSASLDYQHSFRRKGETLTASYKFDYSATPNSYENDIRNVQNYFDSREKATSQSWISEYTLQLDYFNPINEQHEIEFGGKFILRPNFSDSRHEYLVNEAWVLNPDRRNDLDYNQYIGAIYGGYKYSIAKWSLRVGFRGEFTLNDGVFKMKEEQQMFNRYFNLIPYLTIGVKPTDKDNLRLGYTQRLSRPGIWSLNPYWNDSDPLNIETGNPNLRPEMSHTLDVTYGRTTDVYNLNIRAAASISDNSIERVYSQIANGAILSYPENIGKLQKYQLSVNGGVRALKGNLNFNLGGSVGYSIIDANNGTSAHNEGLSGDVYLNVSSTPWRDGSVSGYGGYYMGGVSLNTDRAQGYYCGFSVGQWFLKRTLKLTASISNPFASYRFFSQRAFSDKFEQSITYRNLGQFFGASLQWRFGKSQTEVKRVNRTIVNDDLKKSDNQQGGVQ